MTRLIQKPNVMQSEIEVRINQAYGKLKEFSDDQLKTKFIEGFRYCEMKDSRGYKVSNWELICASPLFYEGIAAQRILNERYGLEYCQKALGYRLPKTFLEKIVYYFTGDLPKV